MGSALLFIVRSRLLVYSAGSGVNRVQVVLSGFSKRLFCFVQAKALCRYGCMYFLAALVLQTTQPTSGGDVTANSSCCANCVEPPRPQQWWPDLQKGVCMFTNQYHQLLELLQKKEKGTLNMGPMRIRRTNVL